MPDFPFFDLAPAVYWLRGVFPFDLLALFLITGILVAGFVASLYVICKYF